MTNRDESEASLMDLANLTPEEAAKLINTPVPKKKFFYDPSYAGVIGTGERTFVSKGWGWEDWLWNSNEYCGKVLFVKAGKQCSWHYHKKKDETFFIQSGRIFLYTSWEDSKDSARFQTLEAGQVYHVPRGLRHRFYACRDSYIIEMSTQHFDDDSIRVEPGD